MLQHPESVLSECKNAVSGEHLVGFRLNRQEPDGGLLVFCFFFKHRHTTWCSAGQSQTCSHSLQAINQYAGPTGRETCGLIYEKVLELFIFLQIKIKSKISIRTFKIKSINYFPW